MNLEKVVKGVKDPGKAWRYLTRGQRLKLINIINDENISPEHGVRVMEEDWDNLIILDACRYDLFEKHNSINGDLSKVTSRGETTPRFLEENFAGQQYNDVVYVCGNAMVGRKIDNIDVFHFVGLWTDQDLPDFDRTYRDIVPPQLMVEKTLEMQDRFPNKRLVAHFLQPHAPFIVRNGEQIPRGSKYRDFTAARKGEVSAEEIRAVYEENVEYTLDYVEELIDDLVGKTVVTADHGELLGEGIPWHYEILHPQWSVLNRNRFDFAHYAYIRKPELIEVPWLVVEDEVRKDIQPGGDGGQVEMNEEIVEDRLEALGYR